MRKRPFYFNNIGSSYSIYYRKRNLRHQLIKWMIETDGYPEEMPDGEWIITLKWHRSFIPGLHFGEA